MRIACWFVSIVIVREFERSFFLVIYFWLAAELARQLQKYIIDCQKGRNSMTEENG